MKQKTPLITTGYSICIMIIFVLSMVIWGRTNTINNLKRNQILLRNAHCTFYYDKPDSLMIMLPNRFDYLLTISIRNDTLVIGTEQREYSDEVKEFLARIKK